MSGEIEAAADAVTGGLLARAVDGGVNGAEGGNESTCLNCGTTLIGAHCHACGQAAHVHRSLSAIWHDIAHGVLHFEGKIWRTLPLLAVRPGELTRRYIAGERTRFISPLALFLFSIFLMFALFSIFGAKLAGPDYEMTAEQKTLVALQGETGRIEAKIAKIDEDIAKNEAVKGDIAELERERAALEGTLQFIRGGVDALGNNLPLRAAVDTQIKSEIKVAKAELDKARADLLAAQEADKPTKELTQRRNAARDRYTALQDAARRVEGSGPTLTVNSGIPFLDKGIRKASENPNLLLYKLQANAYKFSWMLIPISAPFVWLLFFWRREWRMYDHTVFVTYSLAFMTLFYSVIAIMRGIGIPIGWTGTIGTFVPAIHIYFHLKGTYNQSRGPALVRTAILLVFAFIALMLFIMTLFALGASG